MRRSQVSALLVLASLIAAALIAVFVGRDLASFLSSERVSAIKAPARTTAGVPRQPVHRSFYLPPLDVEPATRAVLTFDALRIGQDVPSFLRGVRPQAPKLLCWSTSGRLRGRPPMEAASG